MQGERIRALMFIYHRWFDWYLHQLSAKPGSPVVGKRFGWGRLLLTTTLPPTFIIPPLELADRAIANSTISKSCRMLAPNSFLNHPEYYHLLTKDIEA
jgi:hypothetical protein